MIGGTCIVDQVSGEFTIVRDEGNRSPASAAQARDISHAVEPTSCSSILGLLRLFHETHDVSQAHSAGQCTADDG